MEENLHKPQPLDGKFHGRVFRNRDNQEEDVFVVFVPRDKHLLEVLAYYLHLCNDDVAVGTEQIHAVERLLKRVKQWQDENSTKLKSPDALPGECI